MMANIWSRMFAGTVLEGLLIRAAFDLKAHGNFLVYSARWNGNARIALKCFEIVRYIETGV